MCALLALLAFMPSLARSASEDDSHMEWWRDARFGMFIHWNVDVTLGAVISHSMAGASDEYVNKYIKELPSYFNPEQFKPKDWAKLAKLAGMKYVVFTTKLGD